MKIEVKILREPTLEFGGGTVGENPKTVLGSAGPFRSDGGNTKQRIALGLVAPETEIAPVLAWIEKMRHLIVSDETNAQRYPAFPGTGTVVQADFEIENRSIVALKGQPFRLAMAQRGREQFNALLEIYSAAICSLYGDGAPKCILVCFPEEIAALRIENTALSYDQRQILQRLKTQEKSEQLSLFDNTPEEMSVASELLPQAEELLERNFHRALKAKCMMEPNPVPVQVLRRQTYISDEAKQSDATRAWNLSVGLYYKTDHIPWRPAELPKDVCFAGISFHHLKKRGGSLLYSSVAHAFSNELQPFILKGTSIPHTQTRDKRPYLEEKQAGSIMNDIIGGYESRTGVSPSRVVIHKTSRYQPEEERGFLEAARSRIPNADLVWLTPTGFRLLRRGMQEPLRGTLCRMGSERSFLFTTGYVPWWEEYPGPHIPAPLEIGALDVEGRSREILSLSKMNWNSADGIGRLPITLSFARRVGMIMTELDEDAIPNPSYRFYM
jgi:hypothetical protein